MGDLKPAQDGIAAASNSIPGADRPLVTFALFAYNQELFIREAVEGAFAQTYEPLEIILSDDCSTDSTFRIMQEMATSYKGGHTIIVRRSSVNRGLGLHIKDVADLASGEFIVVAAGDDISLPQRTLVLVELMRIEGTEFSDSNYNEMNESGVINRICVRPDYSNNYLWSIIDADKSYFACGATAAYKLIFLRSALSAACSTIKSGKLYNEDMMIAAYAVAANKKPSNYCNEGLVNYRIVSSSLSNFWISPKSLKDELIILQREKFYSMTRIATLSAICEIFEKYPAMSGRLNFEKISADMQLSRVELMALSDKISARAKSIVMARSFRDLKIFLSRLFGIKFLLIMRRIRRLLSA